LKISVIVPVYKTKDYLERCINSLINQTYSNLEIILVDDGSPDSSGAICDDYSDKDVRIRVIHKTNGGLSSARNAGLDVATGDYIIFVDSDDDISCDFCQKMLDTMISTSADIVECDRFDIYDTYVFEEFAGDGSVLVYKTVDALELLVKNKIFHQTVWAKLYKASIIKDLFFEHGKIHEDEFYTWQAFVRCRSIARLNSKLYNYYHRDGSIMEQKFSISRLDALEARMHRHRFICTNFPDLILDSKMSIAFPSIFFMQSAIKSGDKILRSEVASRLKQYLKNLEFSYKEIRKVGFKNRIWLIFALISLESCAYIRLILKRPY